MDPGLGKSFISFAYMCAKYLAGEIEALLIFCPVSVRYNWLDELQKFMPDGVTPDVVVIGAKEKPADVLALQRSRETTFKIALAGVEGLASTRLQGIIEGYCRAFKGSFGGCRR